MFISHLRLYTDGGSRGNPGPSGIGAVLMKVEHGQETIVHEISEYIGETTNNQAEYRALIAGLEHARRFTPKLLEVRMDSELAIRQLSGIYRVKNPEIAKRFLEINTLRQAFTQIVFQHIRREKNTRADELVNDAINAELAHRK